MRASTESQGAHCTPRAYPHPASNGREDCWSEGATSALIEAWGDRYLQLNRGNLRQKDWKDVADSVNARHDGGRPRKTDVQCKNRIDTLKKKYKAEKARATPSAWPFYARLDRLIGAAVKPIPSFTVKPLRSNPPAVCSAGASSRFNSSDSSRGGGGGDDGDDEGDDVGCNGVRKRRRSGGVGLADGGALRDLAAAIMEFGDIYERIERSKQKQMMELERQRMEFCKELEFQRMNMFMEAQLEIEKIRRLKFHSGTSGKKL